MDNHVEHGGRILALDLGTRRTGVALSDPTATLATPLETLSLPIVALVARISELIRAHAVATVVIGYPGQPGGKRGTVALLAEKVGAQLEHRAGVRVVYWDEALTTWDARARLAQGAPTGRRRRPDAAKLDRVAAALILQDYLDAMRVARRET